MNIDDIKTITVIGAGNMGHQISLQCALKGFTTICTDISEDLLKKADDFVDSYLAGRVEKGKLSTEQARDVRQRIHFTPSLEEAAKDTDYVIEAVLEVLDLKRKIFADLDRIAPPHAILATNSSAIVSSKIADVTSRPEKVINLHFFNPALVMELVEVVQGPHVSEETVRVSMELCKRLHKKAVHVKKEVKGFLLNRILLAMFREAFWLLDMDVASIEDIDKACIYGAGHPMGPFTLNDLTGLDLMYTMEMETFRETGNVADRPSPNLVKQYVEGRYGKKTGKGWYDYSDK
ncbi:3-hydroxyacyl-CoA dehydrogenase family protein [Desulforhopalus singaporensis]|uniref:3-hydroxybutyryl-CoA dehydrogenase n=1 Tax=Desulforhopalus singaporensis TaxID=91360 RepID=A0A1H0V096_9BACT|nr:3-hydroxyacyl-CoA dehydrogenase family protein [Desulforhopalus singaporensis]SDP71763.1 3-hydroxybutyryl-CoA dehydrogenase [Desulforhopalus singaporensis]